LRAMCHMIHLTMYRHLNESDTYLYWTE